MPRHNHASIKRRERLRENPELTRPLWMLNDGLTHAQPHVVKSHAMLYCSLTSAAIASVVASIALAVHVYRSLYYAF